MFKKGALIPSRQNLEEARFCMFRRDGSNARILIYWQNAAWSVVHLNIVPIVNEIEDRHILILVRFLCQASFYAQHEGSTILYIFSQRECAHCLVIGKLRRDWRFMRICLLFKFRTGLLGISTFSNALLPHRTLSMEEKDVVTRYKHPFENCNSIIHIDNQLSNFDEKEAFSK